MICDQLSIWKCVIFLADNNVETSVNFLPVSKNSVWALYMNTVFVHFTYSPEELSRIRKLKRGRYI